MYTSEFTCRVRYAETDQMQVVYHGNYVTYYEVGRTEWTRTLGFTYQKMEETGIIMPVVRMHMDFLRPLQYDDEITIKTSLPKLPNDHRVTFHQEIWNNGKIASKAEVTLYFLDRKTMGKATIPKVLEEILLPYYQS